MVKKIEQKKSKPIERVYKDGREAIVMSRRKNAQRQKPAPQAITERHEHKPVGPEAHFTPIRFNEYELPSYNVTKITVIPKDPLWIYVYWDISKDDVESVRAQLGGTLEGCAYVLRMYDVTHINFNGTNANHWFDIEVGPHANNWYINTWHDNMSYCADIGIRTNSGRFFKLARSNFVTTPRAHQAGRYEETWMDVKQDLRRPFDMWRSHAQQWDKKETAWHESGSRRRKIYLSDLDIKRYYSKLSPLLRAIMLSRLGKKSKKRIYRYADLIKPGSREWLEMSHGRALRKILLGASEMMFVGGSESLVKGASEFVQPEKKRKFFFEIGAELIVYGRTEPDAELKLGDKKIDLRKDGTFTLRYSLPDGKISLPFTATSKDKVETRKITTGVERKTHKI